MDYRENAGYIITDSCHVGDSEFVLGVHLTAPQQFVTWKCTGRTDYYWGHYFSDLFSAQKDLVARAQEEVQCLEEQRQNAIAPEAPPYSPWGNVQECETLCPGVYSVSTPGHGGIMVRRELAEKVFRKEALNCGYLDQKQSAEAFAEVADLVKEDVEPPTLELADDSAPEPEELTAFEKYADVYAQNSDLVGWITVPGTRIDYPVMQTKDNPNFYLKHAFDQSYSSYGVPYMQENCDIGISDNLVLYGHHMNNGSMFSDLCKYESEDFYREHKTIRFDTLDSFGEYEVIAAFKTVAYSEEDFKYYHFVNAESAGAFDGYIAECKALALYDTGVSAEYGDQLITLSTCEYSRTNGRMVVVAKLLEE